MPKSTRLRAKEPRKIYLDYASSALSLSSNPGAIHEMGVREKRKLEDARARVARVLGVRSDEIIFTSGATESNNLAILGIIHEISFSASPRFSSRVHSARPFRKANFVPHIVTTTIEHASVLEVFKHLAKTRQAEVSFVEVEGDGIVDPDKIKKALKQNTILVSVMYANNEIGTIQPISEIAKTIRHFNKTKNTKIFFHTDATQAINYLPISVPKLGVDLLSFNAAKIYGPKGVGVLYIKKNTPLEKIMFGGDQEMGFRPGTENVAHAMSLARALEEAESMKEKEVKRLTELQKYFIKKLNDLNFKLTLNGSLEKRLPNNVNITIPKIPSDLLVIELSEKGIMASAKSACKSGDGKASHVIEAINPNAKEIDGSLRFSLGRETTKKDIDYTVKTLSHILTKLNKWYH